MPRDKEHMTASQLANLEPYKFKKGQSGNPAGRQRNRVADYIKTITTKGHLKKSTGLTINEINTIERKVLELRLSELQTIAKDDEAHAYFKGLCMAVIIDMKNGRTDTISKLRERQYGQTKQQIEVTGKDGAPLMQQPMTQEQAKELINKLEKDC